MIRCDRIKKEATTKSQWLQAFLSYRCLKASISKIYTIQAAASRLYDTNSDSSKKIPISLLALSVESEP